MLAPQVLVDVVGEVLPQAPGGDAFEAADEPGQGDGRRVVEASARLGRPSWVGRVMLAVTWPFLTRRCRC